MSPPRDIARATGRCARPPAAAARSAPPPAVVPTFGAREVQARLEPRGCGTKTVNGNRRWTGVRTLYAGEVDAFYSVDPRIVLERYLGFPAEPFAASARAALAGSILSHINHLQVRTAVRTLRNTKPFGATSSAIRRAFEWREAFRAVSCQPVPAATAKRIGATVKYLWPSVVPVRRPILPQGMSGSCKPPSPPASASTSCRPTID